jgi:hypothetical protein
MHSQPCQDRAQQSPDALAEDVDPVSILPRFGDEEFTQVRALVHELVKVLIGRLQGRPVPEDPDGADAHDSQAGEHQEKQQDQFAHENPSEDPGYSSMSGIATSLHPLAR